VTKKKLAKMPLNLFWRFDVTKHYFPLLLQLTQSAPEVFVGQQRIDRLLPIFPEDNSWARVRNL
jgi:hypothetical protein